LAADFKGAVLFGPLHIPYIYSKFGGEETKRDSEMELQKFEMETAQHMAMLFYIRASVIGHRSATGAVQWTHIKVSVYEHVVVSDPCL